MLQRNYFLLLLFLVSFACQQPKKTDKPNILFLFTDDQRYNTIHALGNKYIITPNIDQLANRGFYFNNAYIMGSMSGAVCAPSRAMLMTGRNLYNVHPMGYTIDPDHKTMAKTLSDHGYTSFHTGKWHNGKESFVRSFDTAKHIFFGGMSDHYKVPLHAFDSTAKYPESEVYHLEGKHSAEIYAEAAVDFLDHYDGNRPFFMCVAFQSPHDPRNMPEKYLNLYSNETMELPPNFMPEHPFNNGELDIRDELLAGFPRTEQEVKANIAAYYAMITHTDVQIGKIMDKLEEKNLTRNTLVVFAGDNGLAVGQHGLMGKQNLYEHSIKVPLLFAGPGIPEGKTSDAFCYLSDIYPTLCDYNSIPVPETVMGTSLNPIISDNEESVRNDLIFAYKTFQRAYRKGHWKVIKYNVDDSIRTQLFNLDKDPWEMNNLVATNAYSDTLAMLENLMQKKFTDYNDSIDFSKDDWNLDIDTESWKERVMKNNPRVYQHLMELVKEERKLRGF